MTSSPSPAGSVAALADVQVRFDGRPALAGVSFAAASGALTVIAGPNGAGKSTLLEVLAGTCPPTAGIRTVRGTLAFVSQRAAIPSRLPVTVRDVVAVGEWGRLGLRRRMTADSRTRVDHALERVDMGALARQPFGVLSGGQQQRTLLAQGLVRGADVLLLDEPTTGLDVASRRGIRQVMREEADRGAAVICVSHDADVIADADRVVRLVDGRVGGERNAARR